MAETNETEMLASEGEHVGSKVEVPSGEAAAEPAASHAENTLQNEPASEYTSEFASNTESESATDAEPSTDAGSTVESSSNLDAPPSADDEEQALSVGRSTALMSALVVVSRLTGFLRTWAQAFGMGATVLASCYELASNLPTQIYELVTAGMLVTAFLPVYVSVKKKLGREGANEYASNLVSLVVLITGAVTLVSFIFAAQIIWTQSFSAAAEFDSERATWFFRFFVIEIVLYAVSTVFQGVVNAERDYLWSSIAPIFNNLVVMASFIAYGLLSESNPTVALLILAIGNPLGVLVQLLLQVPSMHKHGIRLHWKIDIHDPALKDTARIGAPSIAVMIMGFVTNSFHMNAFLTFTALGASIGSYAMLWYNLPYAIFCVPIMTVLFTELSDYFASDDIDSYTKTVVEGANQIIFMLVPFAFFLAVFSPQLVAIISASRFDAEAAQLCAYYLAWRAVSLPVYGLTMFLQKVCSSTRKMGTFMWATMLCSVIQILAVLFVAPVTGLWMVPFSSFIFYFVFDVIIFFSLKNTYAGISFTRILLGVLRSILFGLLGAAVALGIMYGISMLRGPFDGSLMQAVLLCVAAGIPAVLVTFGTAVVLRVPEASMVTLLVNKLLRRG